MGRSFPRMGHLGSIGPVGRSIGATYDSDAESFFERAGIADQTEKTAANNLVLAIKGAGKWSDFVAIYPLLGGTSATCSHNLISSSYQITWGGSPSFGSDGVCGDGSSAYGKTGIDPYTHLGDDMFMAAYFVTADFGSAFEMACSQMSQYCEIGAWSVVTQAYSRITVTSPFLNANYSTPNHNGLVTSVRETDDIILYNQASQIDSDTASGSGLSAGSEIHLLCRATGVSRNLYAPSGKYIGLFAFGSGTMSDWITTWSAAVTAFATTLGRAI